MAASEKTPVLGLSLWSGTDKPRRLDFVEDNEALETLVGGHLQDGDMHLNAERLARVDEPFEMRTYTGTGGASRGFAFSFQPRAAVVWAVGKGAAECSGTCTKQYAGFAAEGGNSLGIALNSVQVTVKQDQTVPSGGSMAALNENGVTYMLAAFR